MYISLFVFFLVFHLIILYNMLDISYLKFKFWYLFVIN